MARDDNLKMLEALYAFECSLVGNSGLTDDSFKKSQAKAKELFVDITNNLRPWAARSVEQLKSDEINSLVDIYKKYVGDPDDPVFQAKLQADWEYLQKEKRGEIVKAVAPETDEQRVDRLIAEREAKLRAAR